MKKVRVAISLDEEELSAYRMEAKKLGLTFSQYVSMTMAANAFLLPERVSMNANDALCKLREKAWFYSE